MVGRLDGDTVGKLLGDMDSLTVGDTDGMLEGFIDFVTLGVADGLSDRLLEGLAEGLADGLLDGLLLGPEEGGGREGREIGGDLCCTCRTQKCQNSQSLDGRVLSHF